MAYIPQLFAVYIKSNVYSRKCTFPKPAPEDRPDTPQLMYILQLLPEYIQYQDIHSTVIYSPIVGSI